MKIRKKITDELQKSYRRVTGELQEKNYRRITEEFSKIPRLNQYAVSAMHNCCSLLVFNRLNQYEGKLEYLR